MSPPEAARHRQEQLQQESKAFFGVAVNTTQEELVTHIPNWSALDYPIDTTDYINTLYTQHFSKEGSDTVQSLLIAGIHDTDRVVNGVIDHHPFLVTAEQAHAFVRDPRTIRSMAMMALRMQDLMRNILTSPGELYRLHPDGSHIETVAMAPEHYGCPAAGTHDAVNPWPIFKKFVPWAADLAIYTRYKR